MAIDASTSQPQTQSSEAPQSGVAIERLTVTTTRPPQPEWGSDVVAEMLRRLGIEYAALNPGASYRGLHDSLVNYNGNQGPSIILCNHEEVAVAVAHGYGKFRAKPMAAIIHANVGLLHGSMGIFDAWVDRVPVLVLGGNGPMDSTRRRPWIDWIHTSHGMGELVRDFTKWEHQAASVAALPEAMLRGWHAALTEPRGPVYLCFDAGLQEQRLDQAMPLPNVSDYPIPGPTPPPHEAIASAVRLLVEAQFPVILLGRISQTEQAWRELVELAELLGAAVLPDGKSPASFPTSHPLYQAGIGVRGGRDFAEILNQADVVLALERIDPMGTLRIAQAGSGDNRQGAGSTLASKPRLINVSMEALALRSWSAEFQELPPADVPIQANVALTVSALLEGMRKAMRDESSVRERAEARSRAHAERRARLEQQWEARRREVWEQAPISIERVVGELKAALGTDYEQAVLARVPLTWPNGIWDFSRPNAFMGADGGGGVGSGPGMSVGIALAAQSSGRKVVSVMGDGDLLMASTALWTAAHHRIPLLVVVANNHSYFNDEEHQDRVARVRNRPPENRWVGQRMEDPKVNFAGLASDLGVEGLGPITDPNDLQRAFQRAVRVLDERRPVLVDVHISPR